MVRRQDASTGRIVEDGKPAAATPAQKPKGPLKIRVKVHSPFKVYFEDEALSVSAQNNTGTFDILPQHHKFITLLIPCDIVIRRTAEEKRIKITRGIMHVRDDYVNVFLDV